MSGRRNEIQFHQKDTEHDRLCLTVRSKFIWFQGDGNLFLAHVEETQAWADQNWHGCSTVSQGAIRSSLPSPALTFTLKVICWVKIAAQAPGVTFIFHETRVGLGERRSVKHYLHCLHFVYSLVIRTCKGGKKTASDACKVLS